MQSGAVNDFSKGSMWRNILYMAIPYTIAQLIQVLYNMVDRIYLGHMREEASLALTGVGLTLPIVSIISAFGLLYSSGGAPLCSIERGRGNDERAKKLLGNCFVMLTGTGTVLMIFFYVFMKPVMYMFGASDITYPYARSYLIIYLTGTVFVMISSGMNMFINSQGFSRTGMATILIGAILNIIIDPLFIFVLDMGVMGAALATVISQAVSAFWVMLFLTGRKPVYRLERKYMVLDDIGLIFEVTGLGVSGFTMAVTNSLTQIACNAMLQKHGGELYVGSMTILNSVREIFTLVVQGITQGGQPVIGFNYGAEQYKRVKQGIKFTTAIALTYMVLAWFFVDNCPVFFIRLFTKDEELIRVAIPALKAFFMGFYMMGLQFCGQSTFVALGYSRHAVFFSLFRKVFIVVPLTILLPEFFGVMGVFYAEPISNFIGGSASFVTMLFTVWPMLSGKTPHKNLYK